MRWSLGFASLLMVGCFTDSSSEPGDSETPTSGSSATTTGASGSMTLSPSSTSDPSVTTSAGGSGTLGEGTTTGSTGANDSLVMTGLPDCAAPGPRSIVDELCSGAWTWQPLRGGSPMNPTCDGMKGAAPRVFVASPDGGPPALRLVPAATQGGEFFGRATIALEPYCAPYLEFLFGCPMGDTCTDSTWWLTIRENGEEDVSIGDAVGSGPESLGLAPVMLEVEFGVAFAGNDAAPVDLVDPRIRETAP